jgi:urease accessory protein
MKDDSGRLLVLLHLCDSLFPLGSFAHSDGLEAATAAGLVSTGSDLRCWLQTIRDEVLARADGPALRIAFEAFGRHAFLEVAAIDAELHAMRPAAATRQASRAMGGRLLKTWQEIRPQPAIEWLIAGEEPGSGSSGFTLPVAFGVVCAGSAVPVRAALEGYFYTRLAATVSAAMRLMPLGQHEAHALLAEAMQGIPAAAAEALAWAEPTSFVPALDIAAMHHQYLHSRLFRS